MISYPLTSFLKCFWRRLFLVCIWVTAFSVYLVWIYVSLIFIEWPFWRVFPMIWRLLYFFFSVNLAVIIILKVIFWLDLIDTGFLAWLGCLLIFLCCCWFLWLSFWFVLWSWSRNGWLGSRSRTFGSCVICIRLCQMIKYLVLVLRILFICIFVVIYYGAERANSFKDLTVQISS